MSNYNYTEDGEGKDRIKIGVLKPKSELNPFPSPKMDIDRPDYNFSVTELLSNLKSSQPRISPRRFRRN